MHEWVVAAMRYKPVLAILYRKLLLGTLHLWLKIYNNETWEFHKGFVTPYGFESHFPAFATR